MDDMGNTYPMKLLENARELHRSDQQDLAISAYRQYLALQPENAGAWADLGDLLLMTGSLEEGCDACDRALNLDPRNMQARLALAEGLVKKMDLQGATEVLAEALRQAPDNLSLRKAFELVFFHPRNTLDHNAEFKRHFGIEPSEEDVLNLACRNLLLGDMPLGWDQFELRWDISLFENRPKEIMLAEPQWNGESLVGKTLLLRWEQGMGDVIMFGRYASLVKARGGRVLLEVTEPLMDLMATCPGIDEVIKHEDPIPPFDFQLPLLSLPRIFRTDLDSIPADIPYLSVPDRVPHREGIDRILAATEGHTRVGLVWAGNPRHIRDAERSIPPSMLKPLEALPVAWHSFQVGSGSQMPFSRIIPMGPVIRGSFADTAYALSAMDLVITVDTSIVHLAGALGLPAFVLVTAFPDWRWRMDRDDSPWYPTLRIYRQPEAGDWASVIERVVADLSACG